MKHHTITEPTDVLGNGQVELYLGDCREIIPEMPSNYIVITDPPYGISYDASHKKYKNGIARAEAVWDKEPFDPTHLLKFNKLIIWGANCFASRLPDSPRWLAWIKTARNRARIRQADFELAWTNCVSRPQAFRHLWIGAYRDSESGIRNVHPTQKPIALMMWCIELCSNVGDTIADPYMGSGTTGVACVRMNRRFVGVEIDPEYYKIAKQRISESLLQKPLL